MKRTTVAALSVVAGIGIHAIIDNMVSVSRESNSLCSSRAQIMDEYTSELRNEIVDEYASELRELLLEQGNEKFFKIQRQFIRVQEGARSICLDGSYGNGSLSVADRDELLQRCGWPPYRGE